jgi:thiosulfate/3-mercaptopyruvate sulfurtransferase
LQYESRCGHIKGAKSLPAKWFEYVDWIEIVRSKKILPQHKIVVYGYSSAESEKVAKAFLHAGYNDVSIYNQFITEWSSNIVLPMQYLERFTQLVYPQWIVFTLY